MTQTTALIDTLKQALKSHRLTYAEVARQLDMSEANVKRMFAAKRFTLERLEEVCKLMHMELSDLFQLYYDFYSIRYVFAGAEKLLDEVRRTWQDKFGVRIFEGYGATETSPVIAANTPLANRSGTVGRMMPGIEYRLIKIPGLEDGQRLQVRGPNVMLGYLLNANPGVLVPPVSELGAGWYDTGDIVNIDDEGFIRICGRAKRFAKVAGEMVSLTSVEALANKVWPNALHAALTIPEQRKGEQIVLLTSAKGADRAALLAQAQTDGVAEIAVPRQILVTNSVPVLGTGKIDYVGAKKVMEALL